MLGATGIVVLAATMANLAAGQGFVIWLAFQQGYWIGWKRTPVHRSEHPMRFYRWTAAHTVMPAVYAVAAISLSVVAVRMFTAQAH